MPAINRHQTLCDAAVQFTGHIEGWWEAAVKLGTGLTDDQPPGTELDLNVINSKNVQHLIRDAVGITTNLTFNGYLRLGGIGYMQVGNDFKVS